MKFGTLKVKEMERITLNNIPKDNELNIRYSIPLNLNETGKNLMRYGNEYEKKHILAQRAATALYKNLTVTRNRVTRVESWAVCEIDHNDFYLFVNVIVSV